MLRSVTGWSVPGSSSHKASMDPLNRLHGTEATDITAEQRRHDPGNTANRGRAPPGTLRSLPTFRNGRREHLLAEACTASKDGATGSGNRVQFLAINKVDCLGSATEAVVTGFMGGIIFPRTHKGAVR